MRIFKYKINGDCIVDLPIGAEILSVKEQKSQFGNGLMLWAKVEPENEMNEVEVGIFPTGAEINEGWKFINTFETSSGLIFHAFSPTETTKAGE